MGSQRILPDSKQIERAVVLIHKNGEIITINKRIYQVKLFREPNRKIFTSSIEGAYKILQEDGMKYSEADFYFEEK